MEWWHWVLLGLVLCLAEIATPGGFYLMFFGLGGLAVGLLIALGTLTVDWMQWLVFSVVSASALLLLRKPLVQRLKDSTPHRDSDTMVGEHAKATTALEPGATGQVELRGTVWKARNVGESLLVAGQNCRVMHVHGLTLDVKADS